MLISLDNHKETLSLAGKDVNDASLRVPLISKGFSDAFEDSQMGSNGFSRMGFSWNGLSSKGFESTRCIGKLKAIPRTQPSKVILKSRILTK